MFLYMKEDHHFFATHPHEVRRPPQPPALYGAPVPIVPPGYRRHVFDLLHGLSHPSSRASKELICRRVAWNEKRHYTLVQ